MTDTTRIERVASTITEIADKGGKVILLAHFGRPKGGPDEANSLRPVAAAVAEVIRRPVGFATDCIGEVAADAIAKMKNGDILLLENTRFYKGEEKNDPAFVEELAKLGDLYVNDAFSAAHRAHASTEGVAHKLPAYAGRAMQAELEALTIALGNPERPVAAIVGGAKVSTKLELLGNLIKKVDVLIIGGGMANTFLFAAGQGGRQVAVREGHGRHRALDHGGGGQGRAAASCCRSTRWSPRSSRRTRRARVVDVDHVADDEMILDIGPKSVVDDRGGRSARSRRWCGTARSARSRRRRSRRRPSASPRRSASSPATASSRRSPAAATPSRRSTTAGVADQFTYVSAAGGAFLEWMEGKALARRRGAAGEINSKGKEE